MATKRHSDWQWYWRRSSSMPMLVMVDLNLAEPENRRNLVARLDVAVPMAEPGERGVEEKLVDVTDLYIEETIRILVDDRKGRYAGSITNRGTRRYHFYLPAAAIDVAAVEQLSDLYPPYELRANLQEDSQWTLYDNFLFPKADEWQLLSNKRQLSSLKSAGTDLIRPRRVLHNFRFQSPKQRQDFARLLSGYGFELLEENGSAWYDQQSPLSYGLTMASQQSLNRRQMDDLTMRLLELAQRNAAHYDGWRT